MRKNLDGDRFGSKTWVFRHADRAEPFENKFLVGPDVESVLVEFCRTDLESFLAHPIRFEFRVRLPFDHARSHHGKTFRIPADDIWKMIVVPVVKRGVPRAIGTNPRQGFGPIGGRDGPAFHPSGIDFELAVIVPPREFELFLEECPHGFVWVDAYFVGDHEFLASTIYGETPHFRAWF